MPFNQFITGRKSQINTSGVALSDVEIVANDGILLIPEGNVFISPSSYNWNGYNQPLPLSSGQTLFVPCRQINLIYCQAPSSGVTIRWILV